jgi:hypothetical protein
MPDLPPELVEAADREIASWASDAPADRVGSGRSVLEAAIRALPACVLIVDDKGNVTQTTADALVRERVAWMMQRAETSGLGSAHGTGVEYDAKTQAFRYGADR